MITKLTRIIVENKGELQTSRPPNNTEIMNKINEIIEYVNKLEKIKVDKPILGRNCIRFE